MHESTEETVTEDSNGTSHVSLETSQSYETPSTQHISTDSIQDLDVSNLSMSPSQATPRPPPKNTRTATQAGAKFAEYPSAYEALRHEVEGHSDTTRLSHATAPETPGKPTTADGLMGDIVMRPETHLSPFLPPQPRSVTRPSPTRKKTDPLLHRVLDKTYRIQATPMANRSYALPSGKTAPTPGTAAAGEAGTKRSRLLESTLSSSPEIARPQLHAEIFSSPQRKPRTPGVSVLTPGRQGAGPTAQTRHKTKTQTKQEEPRLAGASHGRHGPTTARAGAETAPAVTWDSEDDIDVDDDLDDEDDMLLYGQSPPRTMQFHVPQSRLLKTPGMCLPASFRSHFSLPRKHSKRCQRITADRTINRNVSSKGSLQTNRRGHFTQRGRAPRDRSRRQGPWRSRRHSRRRVVRRLRHRHRRRRGARREGTGRRRRR